MGDHYCCPSCYLRYDDCRCGAGLPAPLKETKAHAAIKNQIHTFKPFGETQLKKVEAAGLDMEDVRYFHEKFQRHPDEKTASQLIKAVKSIIKGKGK